MGRSARPKRHQDQSASAAAETLPDHVVLDLNNILTVMLGFTELALTVVTPDSMAQRRLQEVLRAGKRAKELVEQASSFRQKTLPPAKP